MNDITYRPELLQDLQYYLMQRCEYGSPVRYLWVGWKELPFEEVPPLREIVVVVENGPDGSAYYCQYLTQVFALSSTDSAFRIRICSLACFLDI